MGRRHRAAWHAVLLRLWRGQSGERPAPRSESPEKFRASRGRSRSQFFCAPRATERNAWRRKKSDDGGKPARIALADPGGSLSRSSAGRSRLPEQ